ncbi:MAG TPA: sulfate transporter CysZ [Nevskiales bacterium]|nr:sulfate transporter CysZ [Nevskiales bacterium]
MLQGPLYLARGFRLMWQPGVRRFVLIPLLINIAVVVALFLWLWPVLQAQVAAWLGLLPGWLSWLEFLVWPLLWLLAFLLFCFALSILANLAGAPFNGFLAARVERLLTGRQPESGLSLWQETLLGLVTELRKLLLFACWALPLALLSLVLLFIPGLNALIPVLWLTFGAYMLALEYLDYPASNHGLSFAQKRAWLARHRWPGLGFGAVVTLATALPLANLLVMPAAVAGATAFWVEHAHKEKAA